MIARLGLMEADARVKTVVRTTVICSGLRGSGDDGVGVRGLRRRSRGGGREMQVVKGTGRGTQRESL